MDTELRERLAEIAPLPISIHGLRPSTLQLFGLHLIDLRQGDCRPGSGGDRLLEGGEPKSSLALADLAKASGRTTDWHAAVERGELLPTRLQLLLLDLAYPDSDRAPEDVLRDLDSEPWGSRAIELREKFGVKIPEPPTLVEDSDVPDAIFPILDEVNRYERLFILGPLLLLAGLVISLTYMQPLSGDGPMLVWPDLTAVLFVGTSLLGFGALFVDTIGTRVARLCRAARRKLAPDFLARFDELRDREKIRLDDRTNWFQPAELQHLPVTVRPTIRLVAIKTEIAERIALICAIGAALMLLAFAVSVATPGAADVNNEGRTESTAPTASTQSSETEVTTSASDTDPSLANEELDAVDRVPEPSAIGLWLLASVGLSALALLIGRSSQRSARRLAGYLVVGLGLAAEVNVLGDLSAPEFDPR